MAPPKLTLIRGEGQPRPAFTADQCDELLQGIPDSRLYANANDVAQSILGEMARAYAQSLGPRRLRLIEGGRKG